MMKKVICLAQVFVFCMVLLCGCGKASPSTDTSNTSAETPVVEISYDEVSYIIPGEVSKTEESEAEIGSETENSVTETSVTESKTEESQPPEQQTGGLLVKMVKYDYDNTFEQEMQVPVTYVGSKGNVSIAILDITNETDKHYSVTIKGKYLDKNGKILKTETQTWDQFKAHWQKYFLFRPGFVFDKFEYTIETKEYTGDCWKCDVTTEFVKLGLCKKTMHPQSSTIEPVYTESIELWANQGILTSFPITHGHTYFILLDEANEVIGIYQRGANPIGVDPDPITLYSLVDVYVPDINGDHKITEWPERLKNVKCITIISWVDKAKY